MKLALSGTGRRDTAANTHLMVPFLSEKDDAEKSEGGIDPLGLEAIADALGTRLVPGVRERQTHPRYLTAIAVGLAVCERFDDGTLAKDGISEPWLASTTL